MLNPPPVDMEMAVIHAIKVELLLSDLHGGWLTTGRFVDITDHPLVGQQCVIRGDKIVLMPVMEDRKALPVRK